MFYSNTNIVIKNNGKKAYLLDSNFNLKGPNFKMIIFIFIIFLNNQSCRRMWGFLMVLQYMQTMPF